MRFYCFPKAQPRCLVYSSFEGMKSRLFNELMLQASPKSSFLYSIRKSRLGHLLTCLSRKEIEVPDEKQEYIGILKEDRKIFFQMEGTKPVKVWKSGNGDSWKEEPFLGHQIITRYSIDELEQKKELLRKAFLNNKSETEQNGIQHGDFTHFNILCDSQDNIFIIDRRGIENSSLYDFFYFYSYLKQHLELHKAISDIEKKSILHTVGELIVSVCNYQSIDDFNRDFANISIPKVTGIKDRNRDRFLVEFRDMFEELMKQDLHEHHKSE